MQWQQQRPLTFCSGRPRPLPVTPDRSPYFHLYRLSLSLPLSQPVAHTQTTDQLNNRTLHPCTLCAEHRVMAACTHYISVHIKYNNTTLKGLSKKDKRCTLYRKTNASTHTLWKIHSNHVPTIWQPSDCVTNRVLSAHEYSWRWAGYHGARTHTHTRRWLAYLIGKWQRFRWRSQLSTLKGIWSKHLELDVIAGVNDENETYSNYVTAGTCNAEPSLHPT